MSISAEPFAEASTTFERQLVAIADRLPDRRASHTATPTMTTAPSKIHSHRSEEADPPLATGDGEGDSVDGEGAGATADDIEMAGGSIGTPLDNAVGYGCWNVARLLVQRGARVSKLWHAAALGLTRPGNLTGTRSVSGDLGYRGWLA